MAPMKPTVSPLPFVGYAFRFELVRVPRRAANDRKRLVVTSELEQTLRHELSPYMLRDVGVDCSRTD